MCNVSTLLLLLLLPLTAARSQPGTWVSHPQPPGAPGPATDVLWACGDDCIGCLRTSSTTMLFFDARTGIWSELTFPVSQLYRTILAKGSTVFAYTDTYLIGFSAAAGACDTIRYTGTPIQPVRSGDNDENCSYQIWREGAMFCTRTGMYVFDGRIGEWRVFDLTGTPMDGALFRFLARDGYMAMIVSHPSQELRWHTVYSLETGTFTQQELYLAPTTLSHGYAGAYAQGTAVYHLCGYSAATNQFSTVSLFLGPWASGSGAASPNGTTFAFYYEEPALPGSVTHMYAFDTRIGLWVHAYSANSSVEGGTLSHTGPGAALYTVFNYGSGGMTFTSFYGLTSQFSTSTPLMTAGGSPGCLQRAGGSFVVTVSAAETWGKNLETGVEAMGTAVPGEYGESHVGHDFALCTRIPISGDSLALHAYNQTHDRWSTARFPANPPGVSGVGGNHVYVLPLYAAQGSAAFYSSPLDAWAVGRLMGESVSFVKASGVLGYAGGTTLGLLFDALTGTAHDVNTGFSSTCISDRACVAWDGAGNARGYSALTHHWAELATGEIVEAGNVEGAIGLMSTRTGTTLHRAFHAYNGWRDGWVQLLPEGSPVGSAVGAMTALVVRSSHVYAFLPNRDPADVDAPAHERRTFRLDQNYPNPFNPVTTIRYAVPVDGVVRLAVYDVLGREAAVLVNEEKPPGEHTVVFDGSRFASGTYFCRLTAGPHTLTRRILLVR